MLETTNQHTRNQRRFKSGESVAGLWNGRLNIFKMLIFPVVCAFLIRIPVGFFGAFSKFYRERERNLGSQKNFGKGQQN